ncbi:TolC family protein, partial [Legionella pneumophila]|nr:TolC family protein [Legionella pneumophila]MDW9174988.1 TolC family protein [Legionella pneumophila]
MRRFNFKKGFWVILITSLINYPVFSLSHAAPILALEKLIEEAKGNNPQIKAAQARWIAANRVAPQARSLPDPKVSVGSPMNIDPMRLQMIGASQE